MIRKISAGAGNLRELLDTGETYKRAKPCFDQIEAVTTCHRKFAITDTGYFRLLPRRARERDEVFILNGCVVPFVLRRHQDDKGKHRLLGETYIHGLMQGLGQGSERSSHFEKVVKIR